MWRQWFIPARLASHVDTEARSYSFNFGSAYFFPAVVFCCCCFWLNIKSWSICWCAYLPLQNLLHCAKFNTSISNKYLARSHFCETVINDRAAQFLWDGFKVFVLRLSKSKLNRALSTKTDCSSELWTNCVCVVVNHYANAWNLTVLLLWESLDSLSQCQVDFFSKSKRKTSPKTQRENVTLSYLWARCECVARFQSYSTNGKIMSAQQTGN